MLTLTEPQRRDVLDQVLAAIKKRFMGPSVDVAALKARHETDVVKSETPDSLRAGPVEPIEGPWHESHGRLSRRPAAGSRTRRDCRDVRARRDR